VVPPELTALADNFKERVRKGEARYHGSGFKGKGFTFDGNEKNESQRVADMQKRQYELQEGIAVEVRSSCVLLLSGEFKLTHFLPSV
jgi:hypothetical protein